MESRTHSSATNNLTILLFEKNNAIRLVIYTAGTTVKGECSYTLNNGSTSADECMWGHCDGYAVSVCYHFKSFYLIY